VGENSDYMILHLKAAYQSNILYTCSETTEQTRWGVLLETTWV
jgi:hypothetical protein